MSTNITAINFFLLNLTFFSSSLEKNNKEPCTICLQIMFPWKEAQIIITELFYQKNMNMMLTIGLLYNIWGEIS